MTQWGRGSSKGGEKLEEFAKTKQRRGSMAGKEEMVEEGGLNLNISSLSCFGPIVIAWRSPFCTGRSGSDINALGLTMPGSLSDCM